MLLNILLSTYLAGLAVRFSREKSARGRIPFYFLFALSLLLFASLKIRPETHPETLIAGLLFFAFGTLWFSIETLVLFIQQQRESTKTLRDFKKQKGSYHEILQACRLLAQSRMGGLIILERKMSLKSWLEKGVGVDSTVSREILFSIFTPPGSLHDGAVVIRRSRILSAGVILPLTKNPHVPKDLGTRHRAALGMSEVTDALCLVVSEETSAISFADRGFLHYDIPPEKLSDVLVKSLRFKLEKPKNGIFYRDFARV
jgi:uncharacterized protein (TIGR00159 family)